MKLHRKQANHSSAVQQEATIPLQVPQLNVSTDVAPSQSQLKANGQEGDADPELEDDQTISAERNVEVTIPLQVPQHNTPFHSQLKTNAQEGDPALGLKYDQTRLAGKKMEATIPRQLLHHSSLTSAYTVRSASDASNSLRRRTRKSQLPSRGKESFSNPAQPQESVPSPIKRETLSRSASSQESLTSSADRENLSLPALSQEVLLLLLRQQNPLPAPVLSQKSLPLPVKREPLPLTAPSQESLLLLRRQEPLSEPDPPQERLLADIKKDIRRFPRTAYHLCKWPLMVYLLWMLSTWAVMTVYSTIVDKAQPVCWTPWLGQRLPWCSPSQSSNTVDVAKVITSEQQLERAMKFSGTGWGLARNLISKQHTVADLKHLVRYSDLKHRGDLVKELDDLYDLNWKIIE